MTGLDFIFLWCPLNGHHLFSSGNIPTLWAGSAWGHSLYKLQWPSCLGTWLLRGVEGTTTMEHSWNSLVDVQQPLHEPDGEQNFWVKIRAGDSSQGQMPSTDGPAIPQCQGRPSGKLGSQTNRSRSATRRKETGWRHICCTVSLWSCHISSA